MHGLQKAIDQMGSQVALARKLKISPQAVGQWVSGITRITAERAIQIERATGGAVTRAELRPDLFAEAPQNKEDQAA